MTYQDLGYNQTLEQYRVDQKLEPHEVGRIISEHKERYIIKTPGNEFEAELIGNLRFTAESRYDFPALGDWVAFSQYDVGKALIHSIFPRKTLLERKAVGTSGQVQLIASNVDIGLVVQAVDRDFNLNRLERYLTMCNSSSVEAVIVLSKVDLISPSELDSLIEQIRKRQIEVPVMAFSKQEKGYTDLKNFIVQGVTYCLLGSSGVGKSTMLNSLAGKQEMKTGEISSSVNKGKHVTSHRELFVLEGGGILIDNPGMREVGITDGEGGLETTFEAILAYAENCRYTDCAHINEQDCAVLEAVENGIIDEESYSNYLKMGKEKMHFESDALERRKKDKAFGKMVKKVKKQRKDHNL